MNLKHLSAALALALLGVASGPAMAADSANMGVTANVVGTCKFVTVPTLAFGALTPDTAPPTVNASSAVTFWCTRNASYTISSDNGLNASGTQKRMKHTSSADYIDYSISPTGGTGSGSGPSTTLTLTVAGTVAGSAYADAAVGNYSDTIGFAITP